MRKNLTKFLLLTIAFTFALSVNYIFAAWTGPIQAPPGGNTPTPLHIGTTNQVKDGGLSLNSLAVFGNGYFQGSVQVGNSVSSPNAGTIRWTGSDLEVYDGSVWKSLTTGDTTIITSDATDCNNVGGNWIDEQGACYFSTQLGCYSGWTPKESYSSTKSVTCTGPCRQFGDNQCNTGYHSRENKGIETCSYHPRRNDCAWNGQWKTCSASQTEVGCVKAK